MRPLTFFRRLLFFPTSFYIFISCAHRRHNQCHATFRSMDNVVHREEKALKQGESGNGTVVIACSISYFSFLIFPFPIFYYATL